MKFEEAFAELKKDPDNTRMERPHYAVNTGYVIHEGGFCFFNGVKKMRASCPAIKPEDYLATDWEVKYLYHSGEEAIAAYKQGKWISHVDWNGGYYNITHQGDGCLRYTGVLLKQLSENKWLIKDKI